MRAYLKGKDKICLYVTVQPRSRKSEVEKLNSGEYKVRVVAPPSKGEANREVIKILASHFGLPPSRLRIVRGQKSRRKLVLVDGANK